MTTLIETLISNIVNSVKGLRQRHQFLVEFSIAFIWNLVGILLPTIACGRARGGLRAHAGRAGVLRLRGDPRPGGLQGRLRRDRRQPLERRARGRGGQGVHEGSV